MFSELTALMGRPALYEKGTRELWPDEHISKGMLEAHLNPDLDAATRKHATVREIVKWISETAPAKKYPRLLDMGCGPGIYSEEFQKAGYDVTGIDISARSIDYAKNYAKEINLPINYRLLDYFTMDYEERFDLITLIYYEFGVFSTEARAKLLDKIHAALKPGGLFVFEIFTPRQFDGQKEANTWAYEANGGFFSAEPHFYLYTYFRYDGCDTVCERHIVITESEISHINVWEHAFTEDEITRDLNAAGFKIEALRGNMKGDEYCKNGKEMCILARK